MSYEDSVAAHYGRTNVMDQLLGMVRAAGKDPLKFSAADLQGADQLHLGGPAATSRIAGQAGIGTGSQVLDIGSGLGGVARHLAGEFGATVHGVDVTAEFVAAAQTLTERMGLSNSVTFSHGNGTALPVDDDSFDVALLIHVGMNIRDKDKVFAEAARALRPGGLMVVYDVMLMGGDTETYPLPWADTDETSFLQPPLAYSDALEQSGFDVDHEVKRLPEAIAFLERALDSGGPVGVNRLAMGNLLAACLDGTLAPVEIYARLR